MTLGFQVLDLQKTKLSKGRDRHNSLEDLIRHDVVEGVVAALERLLVREPGLLEQVDHHVRTGQLASRVEVDPATVCKQDKIVVVLT